MTGIKWRVLDDFVIFSRTTFSPVVCPPAIIISRKVERPLMLALVAMTFDCTLGRFKLVGT